MALKESLQKPRKPPNLRRGTAAKRCGNCVHFSSNHRHGMCGLYRWPVESSQVSDSWKAR